MAVLIVMLPVALAEELNLVYDANGNLISGDGFVREYDGFNQLVQVKNNSGNILEEFVWHPIEEKILIKKVYNSSGNVAQRIVYVNENTVKIKNSSGTFYEHYVYQDNILVAQRDTDGNKQFIHADHEGSNTLITDINGNVVENTFYSPFQEIISGGKNSRFDGEGKEFDSLTQDYDFHFRKYRPDWGRFTQPDTLIQNVYDPQSLNRYAFERSNPYGKVDPSGHLGQIPILVLTVLITMVITAFYISQGVPHDLDLPPAQRELEKTFEERQRQKEERNSHEKIPKENVMNDANAANKEQTKPEDVAKPASKPIRIELEQRLDEATISEENLKRIKPNEKLTMQMEPPKITFNEKDTTNGSSSSKNSGKMSYKEKLEKFLRLVKESNRREGRCKKSC